jgi:hypothetical protein
METFRLYGRPGCHLCEIMLEALRSLNQQKKFRIEILDIDSDPALYHKYALRIPVLTRSDNDKVICEQVLDQQTIKQILR